MKLNRNFTSDLVRQLGAIWSALWRYSDLTRCDAQLLLVNEGHSGWLLLADLVRFGIIASDGRKCIPQRCSPSNGIFMRLGPESQGIVDLSILVL